MAPLTQAFFSTLYLSLVWPILEYAVTVPVWCPYLVKDIRALKSIHRRAYRLALNQHKEEMPYVDRCKLLNWPSLSDISIRRNYHFIFNWVSSSLDTIIWILKSWVNKSQSTPSNCLLKAQGAIASNILFL